VGWWFVSVVDGRERAFLQLRNALRACEASLGENHSPIESGLASLGKEGAPGDLSEDEDRPILLASNDGVVPKEWDKTPLVDRDVPATMTEDSSKRERLANDAFDASGSEDAPTKHFHNADLCGRLREEVSSNQVDSQAPQA
jgi:hypothetical protein